LSTQLLATPRSLPLVVDANVLIGELLRQRGRILISDFRLVLFITARAWGEMEYELPKRIHEYVRHRPDIMQTEDELLQSLRDLAAVTITQIEESAYTEHEAEARARIPDDPDDWPTVALSLALGVGIWSEDRHFLGYGLATWWTDPLRAYLAHMGADPVIRLDQG
jgi:predicted nucleic acid-binding protein